MHNSSRTGKSTEKESRLTVFRTVDKGIEGIIANRSEVGLGLSDALIYGYNNTPCGVILLPSSLST